MEMLINLFCNAGRNSIDLLEFDEPGARNASRRAEMVEQGLLAPGADPGDVVEQRMADALAALGPVRADGETVRLIAQALQEIEDRIARIEAERRPARQEEALAPGVAVGALGDRRDRDIGDAELAEYLLRDRQLTCPTIDQDEIGPS